MPSVNLCQGDEFAGSIWSQVPHPSAQEACMRKLVLYTLTSLDGAVDDPRRYFPDSDPTVASAPVFDPVMADLEAQLIGNQDAVLMGRNTFEEWSQYWPTSDEQPFADFVDAADTIVGSRGGGGGSVGRRRAWPQGSPRRR
jgi:hypothetical protein